MNLSNLFRRRVLVLGSLALLVASASGCNGLGGTTAATVDGKRISTERVMSLLKDRKSAADQAAQTATAANLAGPGKDTFNKRAFDDTLNQLVVAELVKKGLAQRHLRVKSSDLTSAKFSLERSEGASAISKLPKGFRDFVIGLSASESVLQKQVGKKALSKEAQARAQYAQIKATAPDQLQQLCITGAAFTTKADATTARARLVQGTSVTAAVKGLQVQQIAAKEQCGAASGFPPSIGALKAGAVSAPLANQGTYVVLRLERRKTLSFADVRTQLEAQLPQPGAAELQAEIGKLAAKARVDVDPRYGSWNRQTGRVEPPAGTPTTLAPPTTTTTPSASGSGAPPTSQP